MIRSIIIVILGLLVGGLIAFGVFYLLNQQESVEQAGPVTAVPTSEPVQFLVYENESGFSFEYPENVMLDEQELESDEYANIRLSSSETAGDIEFRVSDTSLETEEEWLEENEISTESADVAQIPFADIEATQIATPGGVRTVAIDYAEDVGQGALFYMQINWNGAEDFWQEVYDTVLSTFAFTIVTSERVENTAPQGASSGSSSAPGIIFEGEEIVE